MEDEDSGMPQKKKAARVQIDRAGYLALLDELAAEMGLTDERLGLAPDADETARRAARYAALEHRIGRRGQLAGALKGSVPRIETLYALAAGSGRPLLDILERIGWVSPDEVRARAAQLAHESGEADVDAARRDLGISDAEIAAVAALARKLLPSADLDTDARPDAPGTPPRGSAAQAR